MTLPSPLIDPESQAPVLQFRAERNEVAAVMRMYRIAAATPEEVMSRLLHEELKPDEDFDPEVIQRLAIGDEEIPPGEKTWDSASTVTRIDEHAVRATSYEIKSFSGLARWVHQRYVVSPTGKEVIPVLNPGELSRGRPIGAELRVTYVIMEVLLEGAGWQRRAWIQTPKRRSDTR